MSRSVKIEKRDNGFALDWNIQWPDQERPTAKPTSLPYDTRDGSEVWSDLDALLARLKVLLG